MLRSWAFSQGWCDFLRCRTHWLHSKASWPATREEFLWIMLYYLFDYKQMYITYFVLRLPYNLQLYCHFFTVPFCWIYIILERNHEIFMIKVQDEGQSTLSILSSYNTYTLSSDTHTPHPRPYLPLHASQTPLFHNTHTHTHTHTYTYPLSLDGKGRKTRIGSCLEHPLFYLEEVESTKGYNSFPPPALN